MAGLSDPVPTLYPTAMLPCLSTASEGLQRLDVSGEKVDCWRMLGVPVRPVTSYHRIPARLLVRTVWVSHSEPLRHWALFIARGLRLSTDSPGVGMLPCEEYDTAILAMLV